MATLVPLKDQLKQTVKGDTKVKKTTAKPDATAPKGKTGPQLAGKSVSQPKAPTAPKGESKMDKCRAIYNTMLDKPRKDVLLKFIADAEMTVAGAQNYYQRFKKEAEQS